jgi:putative hydrolase of the HAD superfamily
MIKNILFDLGGVLYHISYKKTIKAFEKLGIENAKDIYSQQKQSELFDLFETGKIKEGQFFDRLQQFKPSIKTKDLKVAWNKMLIGMPLEYEQLLKNIKKKYRIYLLSNANVTHIKHVKNDLLTNNKIENLESLFDKAYFSQEIGMRKPHKKTFEWVIEDTGIKANETLFIEDSIQHIEGAKLAGLHCCHISSNKALTEAFLDKALRECH